MGRHLGVFRDAGMKTLRSMGSHLGVTITSSLKQKPKLTDGQAVWKRWF